MAPKDTVPVIAGDQVGWLRHRDFAGTSAMLRCGRRELAVSVMETRPIGDAEDVRAARLLTARRLEEAEAALAQARQECDDYAEMSAMLRSSRFPVLVGPDNPPGWVPTPVPRSDLMTGDLVAVLERGRARVGMFVRAIPDRYFVARGTRDTERLVVGQRDMALPQGSVWKVESRAERRVWAERVSASAKAARKALEASGGAVDEAREAVDECAKIEAHLHEDRGPSA